MKDRIIGYGRWFYYSVLNTYSRVTLISILLCLVILLYPYQIVIGDFPLINWYIKQRVVSVALLYLVLAGIINWRSTSWLPIMFLISLILASSLQFAYIVFFSLASLILLKSLKKI